MLDIPIAKPPRILANSVDDGATFTRIDSAQHLSQAAVPNAITPDAALKRLNEGNARYASNNMQQKDFSADRAQRAAAHTGLLPS